MGVALLDPVSDTATLVAALRSIKAMAQVQAGTVVLAFCRAHARRDFAAVGKGWEDLKPWALAWPGRIRDLYHQ